MSEHAAIVTPDDRLRVVERLVQLFRFERTVYAAVCIAASVMLFVSAGALIVRAKASLDVLVPLFGSAGAVSYSTGRVLRMWSEALQRVLPRGDSDGK